MLHPRHPLWLAGFRPFFLIACLSGMLLPVIWVMMFSGWNIFPNSHFPPLVWHAHEMFFGFGGAVLVGFLLTSTKNWVGIRGYHGLPLMLLTAAWLLERLAMAAASGWPMALLLPALYAFPVAASGMLCWTLLRHHQQDSYRDNGFFIILLPSLLLAKSWLLFGDFAAGHSMTLALFRLAFLIMLERTLTQFMKAAFGVQILRLPVPDMVIKLLALGLVAAVWLPETVIIILSATLSGLLLLRLAFWHPLHALRRIDIGIMFVGYLAIAGQLGLDTWERTIGTHWTGAVGVHLFSFGAMGCVIPAMIVRIAKGHTGRKVVFDPFDRGVLYLMLSALGARLLLPQIAPDTYLHWLQLAAACWLLAFGILTWRYTHMLLQPRIDGREH